MDDPQILPLQSIEIRFSLAGWEASIPCGGALADAANLVFLLLFSAVGLSALMVMVYFYIGLAGAGLAVLIVILLMACVVIAARSVRSTHLVVRRGDLEIQHRILGRQWRAPTRHRLVKLAPVKYVRASSVRLQIGPWTVPVHAPPDDITQLCDLINESREIAAAQPEMAPLPPTLQQLLSSTG